MIGTSLGPYKIIEQLGAGGMGEVYLGEDTCLGRKVAIIKYGGRTDVIEYRIGSLKPNQPLRRESDVQTEALNF